MDVVSKIFDSVQKGESFSFIGMEDNCKINVLRFLSHRPDVQKKYLGKNFNKYLFVIVDLNELMEVSVTGFYHLIGLSFTETLKKEKINFNFLNNIFVDSPVILLKSLKEDLKKIIEKTGKSVVILFNEFDVASRRFDLDLLSRNLVALRNTSRFRVIYGFTGLRPFSPAYSFYRKMIWMTPFTGSDSVGVVKRNMIRYGIELNLIQLKNIIEMSGGHAGLIKFIIQNLTNYGPSQIENKLHNIQTNCDIHLQCERILFPLTEIEKSKLKNRESDALLINEGLLRKYGNKLKIFSPILENYLKKNKECLAPFVIDKENDEIYYFGKPLTKNLSPKETDFLRLLIGSPTKIFKREEIMEKVWGEEEFPSDWAFDKLVSRLRKKLTNSSKGNYINTRKGVGISLT